MTEALQLAKSASTRRLCRLPEDVWTHPLHTARMESALDPRTPNHLRAWREFRKLTQEQLAERVETTGAVISLLESGARKLSDKWLRRLAPALNTMPGFLLDHDPNDLPTDILDIWSEIPAENREQALRVLETFKRTGTG